MNMPNFLRAGALALGLACLSPAANAIIITVDSAQYDVTTVIGNYFGLHSTLLSQPWYGDHDTATAFATAVGTQLGIPANNARWGPFFAYTSDANNAYVKAWIVDLQTIATVAIDDGPSATQRTFAVATRVSVPDSGATIALLGAALAGLMVLRRRWSQAGMALT